MKYKFVVTNPVLRDAVLTRLFSLGAIIVGGESYKTLEDLKDDWWKSLKTWTHFYINNEMVSIYSGDFGDKSCTPITLDAFFSDAFKLKVEPQYRPWEPNEIPLGAQIRYKENPKSRTLITGYDVNTDKIYDSTDAILYPGHEKYSRQYALDTQEHSVDGGKTWLPCGVKIN